MFNSYTLNTLQYQVDLCIGCAVCAEVCPHGVFMMDGRLAVLANQEDCMECGACQVNCPTGAIRVESGVGCASAMIQSALRGKKEVSCECG
jgi:NAD-dependent dihydropyrimidine dehydrogenase PreA subunit